MGPIESLTGTELIPEAEPYESFHNLVIEVKNEMLKKHSDEVLLFVAHGGVYRVLCRALNLEVTQSPNAKPFHFVREAPMVWSLKSDS